MEGPSSSAATSSTSSSSSQHNEEDNKAPWGWSENKVFELALAFLPENDEDRMEKIAAQLPGRSAEEVKEHYRQLVLDLIYIHTDYIKLPDYPDDYIRSSRDPRLRRFRIGNTFLQAMQQSRQMQQEGTSNAIVQTTTQQSQEMQQEGTSNAIVQPTTQQSQEMHQEGTGNAEEGDAERTA